MIQVHFYVNWLGELWMGPGALGEYTRFEGFAPNGADVWVPWPSDEYDNCREGHPMFKPVTSIPVPECWSECPAERARRVVERFYKETVGA